MSFETTMPSRTDASLVCSRSVLVLSQEWIHGCEQGENAERRSEEDARVI